MLGTYADQTKFFKGLLDQLVKVISVEELVARCHADILAIPRLPTPVWNENSIMQYVRACRMASATLQMQKVSHTIQQFESLARSQNYKTSLQPLISELIEALRNRDIKKYTHFQSEISSLRTDHDRFMQCKKL